MVDAQPFERGCQRDHVVAGIRRISARKLQRSIEGDLSGAAPAALRVAASVHDRPVQPWVEAGSVAELGKLTPGRDERFLHGVVRVGLTAEDRGGSPEGTAQPVGNQRLEGVNVASGGPLDEVLVADSHHADALRHVHTIETTADGLALGAALKELSDDASHMPDVVAAACRACADHPHRRRDRDRHTAL